jgi:hypothetical protein
VTRAFIREFPQDSGWPMRLQGRSQRLAAIRPRAASQILSRLRSLQSKLSKIEMSAFSGCDSMKYLRLPVSVEETNATSQTSRVGDPGFRFPGLVSRTIRLGAHGKKVEEMSQEGMIYPLTLCVKAET